MCIFTQITPLIISHSDNDEEDGDVVDSGFMPGVPGQTENQIARRLTKGKTTRRFLSNKPQDFQVNPWQNI